MSCIHSKLLWFYFCHVVRHLCKTSTQCGAWSGPGMSETMRRQFAVWLISRLLLRMELVAGIHLIVPVLFLQLSLMKFIQDIRNGGWNSPCRTVLQSCFPNIICCSYCIVHLSLVVVYMTYFWEVIVTLRKSINGWIFLSFF